jgi:hypothetical protein
MSKPRASDRAQGAGACSHLEEDFWG